MATKMNAVAPLLPNALLGQYDTVSNFVVPHSATRDGTVQVWLAEKSPVAYWCTTTDIFFFGSKT